MKNKGKRIKGLERTIKELSKQLNKHTVTLLWDPIINLCPDCCYSKCCTVVKEMENSYKCIGQSKIITDCDNYKSNKL
jgi:hypothetical protein